MLFPEIVPPIPGHARAVMASRVRGPFLPAACLLLKTVLLLAGLIGLLYGGAYFIKRMSGRHFSSSTKEGEIQLIERKYLSPKTAIWLLEVQGLPIVVVDSQNGVAVHTLTSQPTDKKQI
mgnify:CR=1 FL=1